MSLFKSMYIIFNNVKDKQFKKKIEKLFFLLQDDFQHKLLLAKTEKY